MRLPQYDDKHDADAHLTPDRMVRDRRLDVSIDPVPETVVLTYQPRFFDYVRTEEADGHLAEGFRYELLSLAGTDGRVGVVGSFGIGGPATAVVVEQLATYGVERFCILGASATLQPDVTGDHAVVVERAVRDEGTSHHYVEPARHAGADPGLVAALEDALAAHERPARTGTTWTTDAFFRETVPEVEHYRDEGVLAVDMEAATLFAIAQYRDLEAGALFAPFDCLTVDDWEARVEGREDRLESLVPVVRTAFA